MQVLMVGCGNMGSALLDQWVLLDGVDFAAAAPSQPPAVVEVAPGPQSFSGRSFDALVIAVKPQLIDEVMPSYRPLLRQGGGLFSIAAGTTIAHLEGMFPDAQVIRMMPNLPAKIGLGVTGLVAAERVEPEFRILATRLAEASGTAHWLPDEVSLDRLTAVSGCGSGYVFQIIESFEAAAMAIGFGPDDARALVRQTMLGASQMAADSDQTALSMKQAVMSPKGVTEAGIARMTRNHVTDELMSDVVEAAFRRAREMAGGDD